MQSILTIKLTSAEQDVLHWLMNQQDQESRSQTLRDCLLLAAHRAGIKESVLKQVQDQRQVHPPRRCASLCKLIGPKQKRRRSSRSSQS